MIFRVSDALPEIAPFVEGGGVDARCSPGRGKAFSALNRAIRQLMNEGDWKGMTVPVCLPVRHGGLIVLDERFDAIRLAKWKTGSPIPIYSEGFKFLEGGLDPAESGIPSLVDTGESTPLHRQLPRAMAIMAYSEQVEPTDIQLEIRDSDFPAPRACPEQRCETRTIRLGDLDLVSSPFTEEWYAEVEARLRELEETTVFWGGAFHS